MAYKSFTAGSPVTFYSPDKYFIDGFETFVTDSFYNSSDIFTIKEETFLNSGSFQSVDVRINTAVDNLTGQKLGDDFKTVLFKPDHAKIYPGYKFFFDNNYWLCVSTASIKSLANTVMVRRCNNVLRWADENGNNFSEHCIIDYKIGTPNNKTRTDPIIAEGTINIIVQLNNATKNIEENQRFIFGRPGQWMAYRIYGGGINNFLNNVTTSNTSAYLLELAVGKDFVNDELDNLVLGIADYYKYVSSGSSIVSDIRVLPISGSIIEGETTSFSCYLYAGSTPLANVFTFSVSGSSTVPTDHYTLTSIDGNNFSVENIEKYLNSSLIIDCISGSVSRTKLIDLRGAW